MSTEATDRFDRRLTEEISAVRLELVRGLAGVCEELVATRVEWIRWSFLFRVGQIAVMALLLAYMLPHAKA